MQKFGFYVFIILFTLGLIYIFHALVISPIVVPEIKVEVKIDRIEVGEPANSYEYGDEGSTAYSLPVKIT